MEMPGSTQGIFGFQTSNSDNNLNNFGYESINHNQNIFNNNNNYNNVYMMTSPHFSNADKNEKFIS